MINDFKRELSKIAGIDFFNPRFREVFNRYFPNESSDENAEEVRMKELGLLEDDEKIENGEVVANAEPEEETKAEVEEAVEESKTETEEKAEDKVEEVADEVKEENIEEVKEEAEEKIEDIKETEPNETAEAEIKEDVVEETKDVVDEKSEALTNELLETKIELELVRAGVREDKLQPAMRLAKADIKTLEDLSKIYDIIRDFPEWLKKGEVKDFGMKLDGEDNLTAEERRMRERGYNI